MTNTATTTRPTASDFVAAAMAAGFRIDSRSYGQDYVIEVSTNFAPGDVAAYLAAERMSHTLLNMVHIVSYGSTWGSDSGSVGGHAALTSGNFHMCKSGVGRRFGAAVAKAGR